MYITKDINIKFVADILQPCGESGDDPVETTLMDIKRFNQLS